MAILNCAFYERLRETSPLLTDEEVWLAWQTLQALRSDLLAEIGPDGKTYYSPRTPKGERIVQNAGLRRKPPTP